jgi:hypothetical protein
MPLVDNTLHRWIPTTIKDTVAMVLQKLDKTKLNEEVFGPQDVGGKICIDTIYCM